ncbi:hypothetical protein [Levilactobacillus acidifarinae]|uniref:hypothetical protein n=1 Tax=Levilactobacillus acidifarinae TaxID=267364 RepID=UPI00070AD1C4|nr:hypothetical protein [Levilactobacillus acidifarinae]GEO70478.1 hypothetical protein LAC03_23880 [Levilactobacillus acidifarinae]
MTKKNALQGDESTPKHIDLNYITSEKYQKMRPSEREQVREAIARRSYRVHEFSQNFLDSLEERSSQSLSGTKVS